MFEGALRSVTVYLSIIRFLRVTRLSVGCQAIMDFKHTNSGVATSQGQQPVLIPIKGKHAFGQPRHCANHTIAR